MGIVTYVMVGMIMYMCYLIVVLPTELLLWQHCGSKGRHWGPYTPAIQEAGLRKQMGPLSGLEAHHSLRLRRDRDSMVRAARVP